VRKSANSWLLATIGAGREICGLARLIEAIRISVYGAVTPRCGLAGRLGNRLKLDVPNALLLEVIDCKQVHLD
jgi:hypothetical protein